MDTAAIEVMKKHTNNLNTSHFTHSGVQTIHFKIACLC